MNLNPDLINNLRFNNINIVKFQKEGKFTFAILENGLKFCNKDLKKGILESQCHDCKHWFKKITYWHIKNTYFRCQSCNKSGERNYWYGKHRSQETKEKIGKLNKINCAGSKNPFYGKTHSIETRLKLSKKLTGLFSGKKNPFYGKKHSLESRRKMSIGNKEFFRLHPERIEQIRQRMLKKLSENKYKMTSIERKVKEYLTKLNIKHKYNFIHKNYQYDFLLLDFNIVIEVQGDYWHANPAKYGEGKRVINDRQKFKIKRDQLKKTSILASGYQIVYLWESDINKNNYTVLERALNGKI